MRAAQEPIQFIEVQQNLQRSSFGGDRGTWWDIKARLTGGITPQFSDLL